MDFATDGGDRANELGYLIDEVEVTMRIKDGKITATSQSGAKNGKLGVRKRDRRVQLIMEGTGSDRAAAELSVPQIDRLRGFLDEIAGVER